jgi:UDP-N-acetyl-2-amino-2-deoxyglucuronate dehydrogenase
MSFGSKKFAVIGKGFIYNLHAQAIAKIGGEIVDVVDESNGPDAWKEMVKNTEADCIVILTPNNLHFEMAKFSAENGKIVLCEKPLSIKSADVKILAQFPNIFTVTQLIYHPLVRKLKSEIKNEKRNEVEMDVSVHRDEDYYKSWKGQKEITGGIIFNIGIHYFDLLLYLFGQPVKISTDLIEDRKAVGLIEGKNYICNWKLSTEEPKKTQRRIFKINGVNYDLSSKENLHVYVYKDILDKKGITPEEALKSIELIEKIYENFKK